MDILDMGRPGVKEAIVLAQRLVTHCKEHSFPPNTEISGVAINVNTVRERACLQGKEYERNRIANLLGLVKE